MKIDKKIIIMVMCSSNPTYTELENTIKETWFNLKTDEVEILFYKDSNLPQASLVGNDLLLPCRDGLEYCGIKTILALNWVVQNYNFDYIYRSNLGAYVDPIKMLKFLEDKPKNSFYCGIIGIDSYYLGRPVKFASGSGYFLSKNLVDIVVKNYQLWQHRAIDDVAMGELLGRFGVEVNKSAIRLSLCDDREKEYQIGDKEVDIIPDSDLYHIRLRSNDRKQDIKNMKMIYERNV